MFFSQDLLLFYVGKISKNFIDKFSVIWLNYTNSFAKTLTENLFMQGCFREPADGVNRCMQHR